MKVIPPTSLVHEIGIQNQNNSVCGDLTADLRLCFRICKKQVFSCTAQIQSSHSSLHSTQGRFSRDMELISPMNPPV